MSAGRGHRAAAPSPVDAAAAADDERVAREEITGYCDRWLERARQAYAEAAAAMGAVQVARDGWVERGEITSPRGDVAPALAGSNLRVELVSILCDAGGYLEKARAAIAKPADPTLRDAALAARGRREAVARWLVAQGYELGADGPDGGAR